MGISVAHLENHSGFGFGMEAKSLLKQALLLGTAYLLVTATTQAGALPANGHYVAGQGSISKASQSVTVKQSSTTGIIDWGTFSVGRNSAVTFDNGSGATLNRVTGGNLSTIAGSLHATGSLYLMNSQGVIVSGTGRVTTGGNFVATSGSLSNTAFQDGSLDFKNFKGAVVNRGTIVSGGVTRLAGGSVDDSGHISASAASLDATKSLTIDGTITAQNADGSGGTIVAAAKHVALGADANLSASGTRGGTVLIGGDIHGGAIAADNFVDRRVRDASTTSIAQGAQITADASKTAGGNIVIWSDGHTSFSGSISAKGQTAGGFAEVSSHGLLGFTGKADLTSTAGKTGTLLLDPEDVVISNDAETTETNSGGTFNPTGDTSIINVQTLETALESTNVSITTGSSGAQEGNISIIAPLTWATNSTLVLDAANSVVIDAPIKITNVGGLVVDYAGSFDPIDGVGTVTFDHPTLSLFAVNGTSYTLVSDLSDLIADIAATPGGHFALANAIKAPATVFTSSPIPTTFTGTLEGLGNTISGLKISDSSDTSVGLFDEIGTGGAVRDVLLKSPSVTDGDAASNVGTLAAVNDGTVTSVDVVGGSVSAESAPDEVSVGGLLGANFGLVESSSSTAAVSGGNSSIIGGLVGANENGNILRSYASGSVNGGELSEVGGLVGGNYGLIFASYATGAVTSATETVDGGLAGNNESIGTIEDSYASGAVTSGTSSDVGGLVGSNIGTISGTYALGNVTSGGSSSVAGGLAGYNNGGATISASYSVGAVKSAGSGDNLGGSIGDNAGTATGVYFDTDTATATSVGSGTFSPVGEGGSAGITGLTTAEMMTASKMPGLTFGFAPGVDGFVIEDLNGTLNNASGEAGGTLPILLNEASANTDVHIITDAHQLELIGLDPGATYVVANNIDMSATATGKDVWMAANGFISAGGQGGFTGNLFGSDFSIKNLYIDDSLNVADIGLIARAKGGLIENLTLSDIDLVGSGDQDQIGGLIGISIMASGIPVVSVSNVSVSGKISDTSTFTSPTSNASVGGLAGMTYGNYANDSSSVSITTGGTTTTGGLIGNQTGGTIAGSHATGTVVGGAGDSATQAIEFVGGLVGESQGTVTGSYATGNVSALDYATIGGLIGGNIGSVDTSYATGNVSTPGYGAVGGLMGDAGGAVTNSYATGTVSGGTASLVGGFAGEINAEVQNSYATGAATTASNGAAGGFAGVALAQIDFSFATGAATGGGASYVGGFVGQNGSLGIITNDYSLGSATGDKATTGGFVGDNLAGGTLSFSYAAGAVKAGGGFVGENDNMNSNALVQVYWDTQTTGQSKGIVSGPVASGAIAGLTTTKLESAIPNGLSPTSWSIVANTSLPYLRWQVPTGTPQVISGTIGGSGNVGVGVGVLVNGKLVDPLAGMASGANGYYYELLAPGTIAPTGSDVMAYETSGNANAFVQAANGSLTGVDLTADTLTVDSSAAGATSLLAAVKKAVGSHKGSDLLFTKKHGFASGIDLDLNLDAAAFNLNRGFNVGSGEVDIDAAGSVNETKKGAIKAKTLTGQTDGAANFGSTKNIVADLGAFTTGGNHNFTLVDDSDLTTTGTVNAGTNDVVLTTKGSGHDIAIDSKIAAQELKLASAATITESNAGDIDVATLTGSSAGAATLTSANNTITNLNTFTSGGAFALTDAQALTVKGAVNAGSNTIDLTTTGTGSNLAIDAKLTGGTINLVTTGEATENAGAIDTNLLNVTAATGIDLASKKNAIKTLGTDKTQTGPNIVHL